jgi:hypothetical protein
VRLSVVVPFRHELRPLPTVIQRLLAVDLTALTVETEPIVVADGSTDAVRHLIDPPPRDDIQLIGTSVTRARERRSGSARRRPPPRGHHDPDPTQLRSRLVAVRDLVPQLPEVLNPCDDLPADAAS